MENTCCWSSGSYSAPGPCLPRHEAGEPPAQLLVCVEEAPALLAPEGELWTGSAGVPVTRPSVQPCGWSIDGTTATPSCGYFVILQRVALEFLVLDILNPPSTVPSWVGHPGCFCSPAGGRSRLISLQADNSGARGDGERVYSRRQPLSDTYTWQQTTVLRSSDEVKACFQQQDACLRKRPGRPSPNLPPPHDTWLLFS